MEYKILWQRQKLFKFKEKTFLFWIVNGLSLLLFGSLDGTAQPVAFTYHATTSTLNLETLSLNVGADWKVHIQWQSSAPGGKSQEQLCLSALPGASYAIRASC